MDPIVPEKLYEPEPEVKVEVPLGDKENIYDFSKLVGDVGDVSVDIEDAPSPIYTPIREVRDDEKGMPRTVPEE